MMNKIVLLLLMLVSSSYSLAQTEDDENDTQASCHIDLPDLFEPNVELGKIMEVEVRNVHSFDIKIMDNWGKKVLESIMEVEDSYSKPNQHVKLLENGMDDVHYNKELKTGDYQFSIQAVCNDGMLLHHYGSIYLRRTEHK
jgi:hypothetical protein